MGERLKSIVGASLGNLVEWYDWYCYSALSLYFASAFFPAKDGTAELLNAAAVFAVGFVMRPLGGWILGRYADRRGRRAALTLSVLMMCGGSLMIALCPPFAVLGVASPVVVVFARLLQGLSVGGEYGISATYLSETASARHRGFWSSFQYVTLVSGQLVALAVLLVLQALLDPAALAAWGWRIPFALGAALALVVMWLRRGMQETEAFSDRARDSRPEQRGSLRELFEHRRALLVVVGMTVGGTVAFYTFTTYMQKFLVNTAALSKDRATLVVALALLAFTAIQPVVGAISDRVGRRAVLIAFGVAGTLATVPLLETLEGARDVAGALPPLLAALIIVSGYTAINAVVKAELFPTEVRALGVGLPYAVTVAVFGGTAEYLALLFKGMGSERMFYWYVTACIAVSLVTYMTMRDTRATSRIDHP